MSRRPEPTQLPPPIRHPWRPQNSTYQRQEKTGAHQHSAQDALIPSENVFVTLVTKATIHLQKFVGYKIYIQHSNCLRKQTDSPQSIS